MTIQELKLLEELICFARGKTFTDHSMKLVNFCAEVVKREIKLKETNFITMTDVNGNPIEGGE